jgi:hypothetical protein
MFLMGDFRETQAAADAITNLKSKGVQRNDLEVFSNEPVEFEHGVLDVPSHMSLIVVSCAVLALLLTIWFVHYTQFDYPLVTGGMPLFSAWGTGVVFYELTMLGSIITTFVLFIWESGLLRKAHSGPVPVVVPHTICLRIRCRDEQADDLARSLEQAGAKQIRKVGEPS